MKFHSCFYLTGHDSRFSKLATSRVQQKEKRRAHVVGSFSSQQLGTLLWVVSPSQRELAENLGFLRSHAAVDWQRIKRLFCCRIPGASDEVCELGD